MTKVNKLLPLNMILHVQHVQRWNLVATVANSNVASHSFNVAMLAMAINRELPDILAVDEKELCYIALLHDVEEVFTGDIPTPTKAMIKHNGLSIADMLDCTTDEQVSVTVQTIIKAADLVDNFMFISRYGVGPRGKEAASEVRSRLNEFVTRSTPELSMAINKIMAYV